MSALETAIASEIDLSPDRFISEELADLVKYLKELPDQQKIEFLKQQNVVSKFYESRSPMFSGIIDVVESIQDETMRYKALADDSLSLPLSQA